MEIDYRKPFVFDAIAQAIVMMNGRQMSSEVIAKVALPWENIFGLEEFIDILNQYPEHKEPKTKVHFNMHAQFYTAMVSFEDMLELYNGYKEWKGNSIKPFFKSN